VIPIGTIFLAFGQVSVVDLSKKGHIVPIGNLNMENTAPTPEITPEIVAIGSFVRDRRQAAGMSQRELGELASVGTRFVSELERGKSTVRLDAVNKVLAVFGKGLGVVPNKPDEAMP
jgi:y4mF family transcriptional regulator